MSQANHNPNLGRAESIREKRAAETVFEWRSFYPRLVVPASTSRDQVGGIAMKQSGHRVAVITNAIF